MRILIDGRFIGIGESISRYTLEIVKGILELDKENEYTLLVRPQAKSQISNLKSQNYGNLNIKILDIPHYSLAEQTKLLKYLNKEKFDLVHFTQFNHPIRYRGKFVVSIHDLTLIGHLHRMGIGRRLGFRAVIKSAVKNSSKIITISEISKKDIAETFKADPDKIVVTYLGVDSAYNAQVKSDPTSPRLRGAGKLKVESFKEKYQIAGDYILYTGMWKRHKNLLRMLQAFEKYKSQNANYKLQMVLVGKIDKDEPEVMALIDKINQRISKSQFLISNKNSNEPNPDNKKNPAIITTGFIDEAELPIAYAGALAYIIPSLSEGFGLPPLEAMACGTPVLASRISAMPEILGDAALYFDPYNVDDIASAIKTIVDDKDIRAELSKKGLERVKRYDWKLTAKKTLEVYKEILREN